MRGRVFSLMLCWLAAGCGVEHPPIPLDDPFGEVAGDLEFGMYAADLEGHRPDYYLSDDGIYAETVAGHEFAYFFSPKEAVRPAPLTARLVGIESRMEYGDSLRMSSEWHRLLDLYSESAGVAPRCAVLSELRLTWTRAVMGGEVPRRLTAQVLRGPDGQSYSAHLVARVSVGAVETPEDQRTAWRSADCPTVGGDDF